MKSNICVSYNFRVKKILYRAMFVSFFVQGHSSKFNKFVGEFNYKGKVKKYGCLVFWGHKDLDYIFNRVMRLKEKYDLVMDEDIWIHCKYFYIVLSDKGINELWIEVNYYPGQGWKYKSKVDKIVEGNVYSCSRGFDYYRLFDLNISKIVRFIGSRLNMCLVPLISSDIYQYLVIEKYK